MSNKRTMLVTSALPYANGPIHLGHMLEHIQSDIFVRFQRAMGNEVYFVCADDCHGTPIMLKADQMGISPEQLVEQIGIEHKKDFDGFLINYDNYYKTHSPENKAFAEQIYNKLNANGYIKIKKISQLYDPQKNMFLPDRYVKGTCPKCGAKDQYGDNCEVCSATYNPTDLKDAYSTVSGAKPILKETEHYFFDLPQFKEFLEDYIKNSDAIPKEMGNKLQEWFDQGLKQWDISRDSPYFGFQIPNTTDKYFYVWLDAPIGYMASFKNYCDKHNIDFNKFFDKDSPCQMYHFIGKDILYFHSLFWTATLKGAGLRLPTSIFVHGYVTVNGTKMSKSKGTFIKASTYLDNLNPECLRYYFASKLTASAVDIDLSLNDFMLKVNSDIVGKLVNLASRTASFINKKFSGLLSCQVFNQELLDSVYSIKDAVIANYEQRNYQEAIKLIISKADEANRYIDQMAPWVLAKDEANNEKLQRVCTDGINVFRALISLLSPVMPNLHQKACEFLNNNLSFTDITNTLLNHKINAFKPMFNRIEQAMIDKMIEQSKSDLKEQNANTQESVNMDNTCEYEPLEEQISIDSFAKVDLRVATIIQASEVEGASKLLSLKLDLGFKCVNVFAGIKAAYKDPSVLIGRQVICVANLKPRQMKFGLSEGMVLAAGEGGSNIFLLSVDSGAKNGDRVH